MAVSNASPAQPAKSAAAVRHNIRVSIRVTAVSRAPLASAAPGIEHQSTQNLPYRQGFFQYSPQSRAACSRECRQRGRSPRADLRGQRQTGPAVCYGLWNGRRVDTAEQVALVERLAQVTYDPILQRA